MTYCDELAVYIHWPFCKSKCPYCDFYKELARNIDQDSVIAQYIEDLRRYREMMPKRMIKSIFFGGGTPSLLKPENVAKIIDTTSALWPLKDNIEITLEANPNTHSATLFKDLQNAGINRLSLGVQALNDADLRFLGRTHNLTVARQCLEDVVAVFNNHSADLIYARPHQQLDAWEKELAEISAYGLKHISLYQLTIEEGTVFERKKIRPLDDDEAVKMYDFTRDFLAAKNYPQYEVSNFACRGFASIHNLTYWQGGDYIGIGKSAHGRFKYAGKHYAAEYPFLHEQLTPEQRAEELILMGLRLVEGINKAEFKKICGVDICECINREKYLLLKDLQFIDDNDTYLYVTRKGFPVLNQIIAELCL